MTSDRCMLQAYFSKFIYEYSYYRVQILLQYTDKHYTVSWTVLIFLLMSEELTARNISTWVSTWGESPDDSKLDEDNRVK